MYLGPQETDETTGRDIVFPIYIYNTITDSVGDYHLTIHPPHDAQHAHIIANTGDRRKGRVRIGYWGNMFVHEAFNESGTYRPEWDVELCHI